MNEEATKAREGASRRSSDTRARRAVRWLAGIGAAVVIVLAIALGTLRVLLTHIPDYRDQIQAWVNQTTHLDVRFRELDARWRFFGPEIYITAVEVHAPDGGPLLAEARAASVGFDFWRALMHMELLPGRLRLIEPEIGLVRTADGRIELEGQTALHAQSGERRFTVDDLPTGRLDIADARVTFTDLRGELRDVILSASDITVRRGRNTLEVEAELVLPEGMGATLEMEGRARGALSEPERLSWEIALSARDLELAGWRRQFGALANLPLAGKGNLRFRANMNGRELDSARLRLQLAQVVLPADPGLPSVRYPAIAGDFDLQRDKTQWRLTGRDLELSTDGQRWPSSGASARWQSGGGKLASLETQASYVRLENLVPLASLALAGEWRERLAALSPEGEIRELEMSYARTERAPHDMKIAARFANLGFNAYGKFPGVHGLSGEASGSSVSGRATIESNALHFTMPQKFRSPLTAQWARGAIDWQHDADGWHIQTRQFELRNPHATAETDVELTLPGEGRSPVLKLHSRFRDALVAEGWRYFPVDKLKGKVLPWLDGAFLAGRVPSGEFVIEGPTRKFPFRGGEGEFRVSFAIEGLTLLYADGWPQLESGSVDVEFHNAGLAARVKKATLNGLAIEDGHAQIADLKEGDLLIKARATGDVGQALGFLQGSPAGEKLGATFGKLRGSGPVGADVDLMLPIRHLNDRRVVVATRIEGARVTLADTAHVVEKLTGDLRVEDKRLSSAALVGEYLGGPVRIELTPTAESGGIFENVVRVRGTTSAASLGNALGAPESLKVDGRIDWRGIARIPAAAIGTTPDTAPRPSVRIESTLRGAEVGLPAPVAKSATETRMMNVEVHWPRADEALVRATYGSNMRSQLRFTRGEPGWSFDRGTVRLGAGDSRLPTIAGLELRGTVDELDLSEWLALRSGQPGKRRVSDYLRSAELTAHDLRLFGFRFSDMSMSLLAGERAWSASVEGPEARGTVLVPYDLQGPEPLVINMARLRLDPEDDATAGERRVEPDPTQWPEMNVSIAEFEPWGKKLGFLRAEVRRSADGLVLQSLNARAPTFTLHGSGAWSVVPQGQQGALKLELVSTDLLQTMRDLGYGDTITGKQGTVVANVTWPGAPDSQLLGRLNGTVSIQIDDGQLLSVQPGAGRIFGLMSVAALPRRLSLDFTDFTDKGLAFDSVRGDFTLKAGDAYTENLLLKGPAAEIGVVGRTGLGQRDYDQTAVVTGSLGQSLPVAGALAAGPVVGAALLVFSQIFKEPLKGITRGYYRITGSWDNPVVQRVEDSDKKKAAIAVRTAERKADSKP